MSVSGRAGIRILLADDHVVVRRGLRMVLDAEPDMTVVCEADNGLDAVNAAVRQEVDLAVLDVSMPGMGGLQAAQELARRVPHVRTLILSMHHNDQYVAEARRAGAGGYVLKSQADNALILACRAVMRRDPFVSPAADHPGAPDTSGVGQERPWLTPRESQILALVAEGYTTRQIADMLVISPRTVDRHRDNLLAKLNLRNRIDLTRYAIRTGLVAP
jgi:DNA-binding NarL/FixJ family response regulator